MPELPEVEVMTRQLAARLAGGTVRRVEVCDPKIRLGRRLAGRRILRIRRRGKFIIIELSGAVSLLVHLRMTGWFEFARPERHRLALVTGKGTAYFTDSRRFGQVHVVDAAELAVVLEKLGPEPLAPGFRLDQLQQTSRPVKAALLDQRVVAGVGNIYASEACWQAKICPQRPGNRLTTAERARLRRGIIVVLRRAIGWGNRIFEKYDELAVYDRAGEPCRRCRRVIRRLVLAGRSTFYCPRCQRGG